MIQKIKSIQTQAEVIYTGLVDLIKTELSVDVQWLARVTATPETVLELLIEVIRNERCPKIRDRHHEVKVEERLLSYLQSYRYMGDAERAKLSATITGNKLFLIP